MLFRSLLRLVPPVHPPLFAVPTDAKRLCTLFWANANKRRLKCLEKRQKRIKLLAFPKMTNALKMREIFGKNFFLVIEYCLFYLSYFIQQKYNF